MDRVDEVYARIARELLGASDGVAGAFYVGWSLVAKVHVRLTHMGRAWRAIGKRFHAYMIDEPCEYHVEQLHSVVTSGRGIDSPMQVQRRVRDAVA